ncbi:hypothetical protein ACFWPQ_36115 [Streptomyces sp. NPDC058464]|uniref:hypothetical protein n=1 Tax=Streptomyces sp. NPDC058464 TaxID=3346511 RepID=UPI003651C69F
MTALPTAPAAPAAAHRSLRRLHRPALLVWAGFLLVVVGWLLWLHLSKVPTERTCPDLHFDSEKYAADCGYSAMVLALAAAATVGAFCILRRRTR